MTSNDIIFFVPLATDGQLAGGICQKRTTTSMGQRKYVDVIVCTESDYLDNYLSNLHTFHNISSLNTGFTSLLNFGRRVCEICLVPNITV